MSRPTPLRARSGHFFIELLRDGDVFSPLLSSVRARRAGGSAARIPRHYTPADPLAWWKVRHRPARDGPASEQPSSSGSPSASSASSGAPAAPASSCSPASCSSPSSASLPASRYGEGWSRSKKWKLRHREAREKLSSSSSGPGSARSSGKGKRKSSGQLSQSEQLHAVRRQLYRAQAKLAKQRQQKKARR